MWIQLCCIMCTVQTKKGIVLVDSAVATVSCEIEDLRDYALTSEES